MGFGRVASPGRETRREDADIARRAATLEAESRRLRSLTVAADVAEAFARAEASTREAEAALARGEYEVAAAQLAASRDALRDASTGDGDSPGGDSLIREIRAADREAATRRAIASIDDAIRRDVAARLHASFAFVTTRTAGEHDPSDTNRRTSETFQADLARWWTTLNSIDVCGKAGRDEAAAVARRAGESWGDAWRERAAHESSARVLAEGLERSIHSIRDAWGELPEGSRALVAKTFGEGAWPTVADAVIRRWFSTDNSRSSRGDVNDDDDDDGFKRSGTPNETRLDDECVNALVGAEGAAQALGLVPPPPHVGPVESAAYERDRAERAGFVAAVLAAARDAIVGNPHETMRALGRSGDGDAAGDEKWAPGDGDGDVAGADWRPGIGGAGLGFGDEIGACAVCVEEGADFLDGEGCTVSAAAHDVAALAHRTLHAGALFGGDGKSAPGDGKSAPGDASTAFAAARDALDLFRALRDPENSAASAPPSPAAVCVYRNDCRYLAARWRGSTHHLAGAESRPDGPTRRLVSLSLATVPVLHASGDAAVLGMLARAKADVFSSLDDANGFRDLGEDGASREALNAVRRARHAMGRVCGAVSRLLPRRLGARLARELLAAYAEKVAADALALSDISVDESDSLRGILAEAFDPRGLLVALPGTLAAGGGRAAADAEASALVDGLEGDAWMKGSHLPSMLDARLTDLAEWWDSGRLPALGFDVAEVAGFVRANFEASENRAAVLERLGER